MKNHNGMRPQDVVVLLKLSTMKTEKWRVQDIAGALQISASEVSESIQRSKQARLVAENKRTIYAASFLEFLIYGLKYVFPVAPGSVVRGIPTAHSAPPLNQTIVASNTDNYVWASSKGSIRGQAIIPLYKTVPTIALEDQALYELLALVDAIRVGKAREVKLAIEELEKRLKGE
jgi:hypothetical protein